MKKLILIVSTIAFLFAACNDYYNKEEKPIPGVISYELQVNTNFVDAAHLFTDTLGLNILSAEHAEYSLDTTNSKVILDSILNSKAYIDKSYDILTTNTVANTRDLKFINFNGKDVQDWDSTCIKFKLEQQLSTSYNVEGYLIVNEGTEKQWIDSLKKHSWYVKNADLVYQTVNSD